MSTTPLPKINGLFEAHLTVADLDRSIAFYRDVLGLPLAYRVPERGAAFLWVPQRGQAMLGLWTTGSAPMGLKLHIAFTVRLDDILRAVQSLAGHGISALDVAGEPTDEPVVLAWMPAASIYFRDPDGHLLEYLCMLDDPPRAELGVVKYSEWHLQK